MKSIIIIPSRLESSRFPNKPFAKIKNKPLLQYCYENALKSKLSNSVFVATPNKEIFDFIKSLGGNAIITSHKHKRASDRCAEALSKIEKIKKVKFDIIGMLQGDEPLITSKNIDLALNYLTKNNIYHVVNLISNIKNINELNNKNIIKVTFNKNLEALYFSRLPIPFGINFEEEVYYKQVCFIPFKRKKLFEYLKLKETKYELLESIDMHRLLENQIKIKLLKIKNSVQSVDVKSDIQKVLKLI